MSEAYDEAFYEDQQDGSLSSARIVAPLVLSLFSVKSVIDVGCGVGTWLRAFQEHGVEKILGLDGRYVSRTMLKIPQAAFEPVDLEEDIHGWGKFDLACSLEVAEHLSEKRAEGFVRDLVNLAPVILFSAAVPDQGGECHINERWQSYWAELFSKHGYDPVDCIRPHIAGSKVVEFWYRQNIIVYCVPELRPPEYRPVANLHQLDLVDPELYMKWVQRNRNTTGH